MSKLRRAIVWLILYTQVWTPVLAQALPIAVDRGAPGPRPVIGVSRGVPVVQIAPPSAGGVSDNRYTQFNVGASGAVLNNSCGASNTELAAPSLRTSRTPSSDTHRRTWSSATITSRMAAKIFIVGA